MWAKELEVIPKKYWFLERQLNSMRRRLYFLRAFSLEPIIYGDPTQIGIFTIILLTIALGMEGVAAVTVDVAKSEDRPQEDGGV